MKRLGLALVLAWLTFPALASLTLTGAGGGASGGGGGGSNAILVDTGSAILVTAGSKLLRF